jgi:hypothetical protein
MGGFDPKEINPLDGDLSRAEKSLTTGIGTENPVQCDSSSTFSDRGSETRSVFDPNYDGNSVLGACLLRLINFNALKLCQRMTLLMLKFAQR